MAGQSSELARSIVQRYERHKGSTERSNFEAHWEEIAERVIERQKGTILSPHNVMTKGDKRTQKIFDATASLALERFASVMDSMLTPRNSTWHRILTGNPILDANRAVQLYLEEVNRLLFKHRYASRSNFASQNHEDYISLGAYGTGGMFIDKLAGRPGLRYRSIPISNLFVFENHQGMIDTVMRRFYLSARQAAKQFPMDRLPEKIVKALESGDGGSVNIDEPSFEFIHCVMPNEERDPSRSDFRGMQFASHYIAVEEKVIVEEGGYEVFPYAVSRYVTGPGETYGRSPAMVALPSIKTLNEQKKTVLKQGHRITDPVILAHDDGVMNTFSLKPGAVNIGSMSDQGKRLVDTLPTGNLAVGFEMMNAEREVINDVFLVTLFQILVETPQMTATEVLERTREKGMLLAPTMGRQQSEKLGPQIEREIDVLSRQGLLPPMPDIMREAEGEFTIQYDSPLSRAQRAEEAAGLFRSMEFMSAYAQNTGDTSVFDHIDVDSAVPDIMAINAVPVKWRQSVDAIVASRTQRAKAAEEQQVIDALPAAAGMAKAQQ
jgi:hypothetical protein